MHEFDLIRRFFSRPGGREDTILGVGDDCALLDPAGNEVLAATIDTLVAGVHFLPDTDPGKLGYKALAVSLSDLAAMGAEPAWGFLALTLPEADPVWLESFSRGLYDLATRHRMDLAGGDTTQGPLTITLQAIGRVPKACSMLRSGARSGDDIYVSGLLGQAGLGLKMLTGEVAWRDRAAIDRLLSPEPRVALGMTLRGVAHACIDISDGLAADLGHILESCGLGATIRWEALPLAPAVRHYIEQTGDWRLPLYGGDDYELCFTAPPSQRRVLEQSLPSCDVSWHRIGTIEERQGLRLVKGGEVISLPQAGYRHF